MNGIRGPASLSEPGRFTREGHKPVSPCLCLAFALASALGVTDAWGGDSTSAAMLAAGKRTYQQRCVFCHGTDGRGDGPSARAMMPSPRNFVVAEYKIRSTPFGSLPTDDDLSQAIANGMPGTPMAGWESVLSRREILELVQYIKSFSNRFELEGQPDTLTIEERLAVTAAIRDEGEQLYREMRCFLCHGKEGRGDGPITATLRYEWGLPFRARNLTQSWTFIGGNSARDIYRTLSTGLNGTPMGSYADYLSEAERWSLAHFVASLSGDNARAFEVVIRSRPLQATLPERSDDARWEGAEAIEIPLGAQIVLGTPARWWQPTANSARVKSLYNRQEITFRIEWDDPTNRQDEIFRDQLVLKFPKAAAQSTDKPYFITEDETLETDTALEDAQSTDQRYFFTDVAAAPLSLWRWQGALVPEGETRATKNRGRAAWSNGRWSVVIKRPLPAADFSLASLAVWDGSNRERAGSMAVSSWYYVQLETPVPARVYIFVLLAILAIAGVQWGVIRKMRGKPLFGRLLLRRSGSLLGLLFALLLLPGAGRGETPPEGLHNPHDRLKRGPPLTNIVHKVGPQWLFSWLKDPRQHDPRAKMPNLELSAGEIEAVMAFLASIADQKSAESWPAYLLKTGNEMTDEEYAALDELLAAGRQVWSRARCTLCHAVTSPRGELVGGDVDLRVATDLSRVAGKVKRDWLYRWLEEPKNYFSATAMPRYRFNEAQRRALVEYILRDEAFMPEEDEEPPVEEPAFSSGATLVKKGKRLLELSRCVLCHEIRGIPDLITEKKEPPPQGAFPDLAFDIRCLSCHKIRGRGGEYAPELTFAGSKLKVDWIVDFLQAPDMIRPLSQQMPEFKLTLDEARNASRYIKTWLTNPDIPSGLLEGDGPAESLVATGRSLYRQKGCRVCHTLGKDGGALGPDLSEVGDRLEAGYIYSHLKNPQFIDPYTVEPNYGFSDAEALALTHFLAAQSKKNGGGKR